MSRNSPVRHHSLREILDILGEDVQQGAEFHVHYNTQLYSENPFPYPFRSNNTAVTLVVQGKMRIKINLEEFIAGPDDVIIFSSQFIIHILEVLEPIRVIGLVFTDEYALKNILNYEDINMLRFFSVNEKPVLPLSSSSRSKVCVMLESMYNLNTMNGEESYYREEKTFHYFNLMALEIIEVYRNEIEKIDLRTSRKKEIIHAFLQLLSNHITQERSVQFYADKLFITPGHLSKLLKEASGNTARDVIEDAVILEARNLLLDSSLSLAQIAEKLNFSDQSFFGKFFRKKMKITPKGFRDRYR